MFPNKSNEWKNGKRYSAWDPNLTQGRFGKGLEQSMIMEELNLNSG